MWLVTHLYFPNIDRLQERFKPESKVFFASLSRQQRKELRKYKDYKKSSYPERWSFYVSTHETLARIDAAALKFYLKELKYNQLKLDV